MVDLGTGSGALAQRILKVRPKARLIGIDADASMLAAATRRLRGNIQTIEENFERVRIPRCDVVSASFALHHMPTGRRKARSTSAASQSLRPGGMFVSADCYLGVERRAAASAIARRGSSTCSAATRAKKAENFLQHVGEGGRLLHARSRDRTAEGRGLRRGSDLAEGQLRGGRGLEVRP